MVTSGTTDPARPHRPCWRWSLSLRGLMVLVLVVGGLIGGCIRQVRLRSSALATIRAAGSTVSFADERLAGPTWQGWVDRLTGIDLGRPVASVVLQPQPTTGDAVFRAAGQLGSIGIIDVIGGAVTPANLADLAHARVGNLGLFGVAEVADAHLAAVARIPGLTGIRMNYPGIKLSAATVRAVGAIATLQDVDLHGFGSITGADLAPLARLPHLRSLSLTTPPIDDGWLDQIAPSAALTRLEVGPTRMTDARLRHLAATLPGLRTLSCDGSLITDAGVRAVAGLPGLYELNLLSGPTAPSRLTDASLAALGRSRTLTQLAMTGGRFTGAGLDALSGCPLTFLTLGSIEAASAASLGRLVAGRSFGRLGLQGPAITDAVVPLLVGHFVPRAVLDLSYSAITDAGMTPLAAFPVAALDLTGTAITDNGLAALAATTPARELIAWNTSITPAAVARLQAARPRLRIFIGPIPPTN